MALIIKKQILAIMAIMVVVLVAINQVLDIIKNQQIDFKHLIIIEQLIFIIAAVPIIQYCFAPDLFVIHITEHWNINIDQLIISKNLPGILSKLSKKVQFQ